MRRSVAVLFLLALVAIGIPVCASDERAILNESKTGSSYSMSQELEMVDLFNRWERVWHEGRFDLVPSCVEETYIRHDQKGDRTVTRDAYAREIAKIREDRPGIRVVVYDHSFAADRAWFRFAFKWADPKTGEAHTQAGLQLYRIADGKLAETWLTLSPPGSAWPDAVAQEHWTSPSPVK